MISRHVFVWRADLFCPEPSLHHHCPINVEDFESLLSDSQVHHHRTITAPSRHHHCTITAPSRQGGSSRKMILLAEYLGSLAERKHSIDTETRAREDTAEAQIRYTAHHHCTITAPSLHYHCAITAPSPRCHQIHRVTSARSLHLIRCG